MDAAMGGPVLEMMGWVDIAVFVFSLVVASLIGVYFAYCAPGGQDSSADYLVGGRTMGTIPIALSLIASYISGITLLGYPAEVYVFGCQVLYKLLAFPLMGLFFSYQLLPVFRELQGLSLYGYFARRFDRNVRFLASSLFIVGIMCWLPIVIYVPALALEQVASINLHWVTPGVCIVCIYYTTVGGIKAVVWTDAVQTFSMLACVLLVMVKGVSQVGGFSIVLERNLASTRLEAPVIDFDPTTRHTFFTMVLGAFIGHLAHAGLSQSMIQRYLALSSDRKARRAMWMFIAGTSMFFITSAAAGMIIYAYHHDCDPIQTKMARTKDQILPLFVMETLSGYPGLPGLFIAGVFSAALSSMSTGLNSISAVILEDWVRGFAGRNPSEHAAGWIMRASVVIFGAVTVALVFVVEKLGMVMQMSVSLGAMSSGPLFTLFIVGLFVPWVNTKSAVAGALASAATIGLTVIGQQMAIAGGRIHYPTKPVSVEGCQERFNFTADYMYGITHPASPVGGVLGNGTAAHDNSEVFYLFRISYLWYMPLALTVGLVVSGLAALAGWRNDLRDVEPCLLAPSARRLLPRDNHWLHPKGPKGAGAAQHPLLAVDLKVSDVVGTEKTKTLEQPPVSRRRS